MDEQTAWECFCRTGSVEAYLHYSRLHRCSVGTVKGDQNADRDGWTGDPGADRGPPVGHPGGHLIYRGAHRPRPGEPGGRAAGGHRH